MNPTMEMPALHRLAARSVPRCTSYPTAPHFTPRVEQRVALARAAREAFRVAGYGEIGIDHFALPGDPLHEALRTRGLRRNFQGYTTDTAGTLIGLGASSIGRPPLGLAQNASDNATWLRALEAGRLPVARGRAFKGEDALRASVIEQLLCYFDADIGATAAAQDVRPSLLDEEISPLKDLVAAGWVTRNDRRVAIVRDAPEIARIVASRFDAYLDGAGRHSVAV